MNTLLITITLLVSLVIRKPQDGGNHPRKDGLTQPLVQHGQGFHPPKEWETKDV